MVPDIPIILVIDENKADRDLIGALLAPKYRVLDAPNVASGLRELGNILSNMGI